MENTGTVQAPATATQGPLKGFVTVCKWWWGKRSFIWGTILLAYGCGESSPASPMSRRPRLSSSGFAEKGILPMILSSGTCQSGSTCV